MVLSSLFFVAGRSMYTVRPPANQVMWRSMTACWMAVRQGFRRLGRWFGCTRGSSPLVTWREQVAKRYGTPFLTDLLSVGSLLTMLAVIPFYWALSDQQVLSQQELPIIFFGFATAAGLTMPLFLFRA